MDTLKVLITGASPDSINTNTALRGYVAQGFADVLGRDGVSHVPMEFADERILREKPDLVLVFGSCLPDICEYSAIKHACDMVDRPLAFWLHDDPYEFDAGCKISRIADAIFTNDRWSAEHYHRDNVWHLPLAACPRAHRPSYRLFAPGFGRDVFFCGVAFEKRRKLFSDLAYILRRHKTEIFTGGWQSVDLPFCRNERIANESIADYYATSRVVLNIGRDFHYANAKYLLDPSTPGPRTFEAAMAGACQIMFVDSLEILDYFDNGTEIILVDGPKEFEDVLAALIEEPDKGTRIGAAAQARCLANHTYATRAREMLECMKAFLPEENHLRVAQDVAA